MLSKKIREALAGSSAIRAMFVEGKELAEKVGVENVFDYSLGNPATPVPDSFNGACKRAVPQGGYAWHRGGGRRGANKPS